MHDLLICNGTVVTPAGVGKFDVFIDEGKITSLSSTTGNKAEASKTIDASGRIVIPGGIEPHASLKGLELYQYQRLHCMEAPQRLLILRLRYPGMICSMLSKRLKTDGRVMLSLIMLITRLSHMVLT